ncbi:transketolase [Sphingomonas nostoxanthinifaciens]|uniref:transketolase n=1 Tax=Sphingomonas nostoxanthinifaciens TaxID=2872652 RepID=UPI001CC1F65E|nr:transketolase [Sphingomonas nostoxanthinifaciens]UAK25623.1 transketolase [Sphingomonas nostoxanthinifaciens]
MTPIEQAVHAKAIELGKLAIKATTSAGSGHPTTALSLAHLTTVLMYRMMRWDPQHPDARGSDRLVLSEGHAVPIVYAAFADLGVTITPGGEGRSMTMTDLMALRSIDSPIDGHPNPMLGFPFFDAATGSLGQGLSVAAGLAAAAKVAGLDKTIYCIIGDGESREGQIWEAMDFIADHGLTDVVAIFNCNTLGQSDFVADAQHWQELQRKAEAFNWMAIAIDGHNPAEIEDTLRRRVELGRGKPLCVVARTIKGWGVSTLAGMGHHGTPVTQDHLEAALGDLDQEAQELGVQNADPATIDDVLTITPPPAAAAMPGRSEPSGFEAAVAAEPKVASTLADKKMMSPRRAFGLALKALGAADPSVVALDADVKNSTYALDFAEAYPDRYFEARIAEQNMISAAAGMSSGGMLPFASTFGRFLERAFDQIDMAIVGGANLKLVGTHVGVTLASDGPSQMALADVAFMRAFAHSTDHRGNPAITVLTPSDAVSAYAMVLAMAAFPSACYLRAVRADLPLLYEADAEFPFGGHKVLRNASLADRPIVLVSCGYMVHSCLKAAETLAANGIDVTVVDAYAVPMAAAPVLALAGPGGTIIAVEDSYVGGLGSELAEAAASERDTPMVQSLAVHVMPKSGRTPDDVLGYVHLAVGDIVAAVRAAATKS